jgi:hypothetical protein
MRSCWLLAVGQLSSRPLLVETEINVGTHPRRPARDGIPRRTPPAERGMVCAEEESLWDSHPTRPAKRTGRLQVCAATTFVVVERPHPPIREQLLAGGPSHSWLFGGMFTTPLPLPMASPFPRSIGYSFTAPVQLGARLPFHPCIGRSALGTISSTPDRGLGSSVS